MTGWLVLLSHADELQTSDHQFGFKSKHSTVQCTLAVNETVNYYINNDSSVNCMLLDASKAFDRVEYTQVISPLTETSYVSPPCQAAVTYV